MKKGISFLDLWYSFPSQQSIWIALKETCEVGNGAAGVAQLLQSLSQVGGNRRVRAEKDSDVADGDTQPGEGILRLEKGVGSAVGEGIDAAINSLQEHLGLVEVPPEGCKGVGQVGRGQNLIRRREQVRYAGVDFGKIQLSETGIESGQEYIELVGKTPDVNLGQIGQELLNVAGECRDLLVLGRKLMKCGSRRIGDDVQPDVQDTGDQAFGIEPGAEALPDKVIKPGFVADLQQFVGFRLSELLVKRDENGHGEVVAGLIVANHYFNHGADRYAPKFYRGAGVQSFKRSIEVKNFLLMRVKQAARTEDDHSRDSEGEPKDEKQGDGSWICFPAHTPDLIWGLNNVFMTSLLAQRIHPA